jgi:hypothetical protein
MEVAWKPYLTFQSSCPASARSWLESKSFQLLCQVNLPRRWICRMGALNRNYQTEIQIRVSNEERKKGQVY